MSDNPNTPHENPPLDAEDWQDAFEPYQGHLVIERRLLVSAWDSLLVQVSEYCVP